MCKKHLTYHKTIYYNHNCVVAEDSRYNYAIIVQSYEPPAEERRDFDFSDSFCVFAERIFFCNKAKKYRRYTQNGKGRT